MPSGKRAKQQRRQAAASPARTPPPVRSKGGAGGLRGPRQASPRALAVGGGVVALVVIAIVLAVVLGRGGGSGATTNGSGDTPTIHVVKGTPRLGSSTSAVALSGAPQVATMFKGIPQNHFVLGQPSAPVELTEFIDLQCPVCRDFETTELPTLLQRYVRTGKLRIKMEPWSILDRPGTGVTDSGRGQKATIAAAAQNKAFTFAEMLYVNQGPEDSHWLTDSFISQAAASVDGLDPYRLAQDANSATTQKLVQQVDSTASALTAKFSGFVGTPGLFLSKGIQSPQFYGTGLPDLKKLEAAIDALLK